ncbi:MAG TPA: response regulator [Sphingomicrobium sp.]|nr:response regulator [Sphingomicrobium sp.]
METTGQIRNGGAQPRLLVIDSNRSYLGVIARRLAEFGYRVATADSAQSGLAEMYRIPADLVLCTADLRGTTGIELVRRVRDDPVHRDVPVLLIVGRSDPAATVRAFQAGADGVIRKPCHFEVLAACVARQLARADAMKHLASDKAALDAKIVSRVIELRETQAQLNAAEKERRRLAAIVRERAA